MQITVEIPDDYLVGETPAEFGRRLKLYAALMSYQSGELSAGAACELAGVDRGTFFVECQRRKIAVIAYPAEELREEIEALRRRTA